MDTMPYTVEERRKKGEGMEGKIGANLQFRTLCTNVPFNSRRLIKIRFNSDHAYNTRSLFKICANI